MKTRRAAQRGLTLEEQLKEEPSAEQQTLQAQNKVLREALKAAQTAKTAAEKAKEVAEKDKEEALRAKGEAERRAWALEEQFTTTERSLQALCDASGTVPFGVYAKVVNDLKQQKHTNERATRDLDAAQTGWRRGKRAWAQEKTDLLEKQKAETAELQAKRNKLQDAKDKLQEEKQALELQAARCGWCSGRKGGDKGKGDKGGK